MKHPGGAPSLFSLALSCAIAFGKQHKEQMDTSARRVKTDLVLNLSFTTGTSCFPSPKPTLLTPTWQMKIIMDLPHGAA